LIDRLNDQLRYRLGDNLFKNTLLKQIYDDAALRIMVVPSWTKIVKSDTSKNVSHEPVYRRSHVLETEEMGMTLVQYKKWPAKNKGITVGAFRM
jgi:hypothetical protein